MPILWHENTRVLDKAHYISIILIRLKAEPGRHRARKIFLDFFLDYRPLLYKIIQQKEGGDIMTIAKNFGNFLKEKRIGQSLTLRKFCRNNGFDPGNISKIERGILPPPQSKEILFKYASALGIKEGTDDWLLFCDLAATSAGKIPLDVASNEELMNALPVLFRTVRRNTLDKQGLENLVKSIKKELR